MPVAATAITPGLESPTVSPMADPAWRAVRAMVRRNEVNPVMDALFELGLLDEVVDKLFAPGGYWAERF